MPANQIFKRERLYIFFISKFFLGLLAAILLAVCMLFWKTQEARSLTELKQQTSAIAQSSFSQIELRYNNLYWGIAKLADKELYADFKNTEKWSSEATQFLESFPEVRRLSLVNPDLQICGVVPIQGNELLLNSSVLKENTSSSEIRIWHAITAGRELQGFIIGVLVSEELILPILLDIEAKYMLTIKSSDQTVFTSENWALHQEEFTVRKTITLLNSVVWNISFAPVQENIAEKARLAVNTLLLSLLISSICVISVYLAQKYFEKSKQLGIKQEELLQYQNQLLEVNKELESFSYSVSHDLRAPLRHMVGFAELLNSNLQDKLDEKSLHYLTVILEAAKTMGNLIDDLLAFSRMGRLDMINRKVDLNKLLAQVISSLQPDTVGREIEWQLIPLPDVLADKNMIQLVLENLVSNALKFSRLKKVTHIEIGFLEDDVNLKHIVLYVKDNGAGFDMRYKEKLFGIFQRLHKVEEYEGTGVGLANVNRIIQRHGGRVWAEAILNEGATFYFTLPKYLEEVR